MSYCRVFWEPVFTLTVGKAITCMTQRFCVISKKFLQTFASFPLERKPFVRVICTYGDCQRMGTAIIEGPCCCHPSDLSPSHLKGKEDRSARGNSSFKGSISPSTDSTLKYSNSYLINGCFV